MLSYRTISYGHKPSLPVFFRCGVANMIYRTWWLKEVIGQLFGHMPIKSLSIL